MDPRLRGGDTEDRSLRLGPRLRPAALFGGLGRGAGDLERQFVVLQMDAHLAAMDQLSEQQFLGQRLLDLLLDQAAPRARAVPPVIALVGYPRLRLVGPGATPPAPGALQLTLQPDLVDN